MTHFKILVTIHFVYSEKNPTSAVSKFKQRDPLQKILNTFSFQNMYTLQGLRIHLKCVILTGKQKMGVKTVIFHDKIYRGNVQNDSQ